jgi:hypothetical protein
MNPRSPIACVAQNAIFLLWHRLLKCDFVNYGYDLGRGAM